MIFQMWPAFLPFRENQEFKTLCVSSVVVKFFRVHKIFLIKRIIKLKF